jgi:drug/metabolite transporter (DMT)-like permease
MLGVGFSIASVHGRRVGKSRRVDALLLLVALTWGASYLAAKDATAVLPVLLVVFARYGLSLGACLVLVVARRIRFARAELRAGTVLGVTQCAVLVLETFGVAHTSAAHAGVIISLTILLTPLLDRAHRPPARFLCAAAVSVFGVTLLISAGRHVLAGGGSGDLLMLAAALVRSAHVVLVGRLTATAIRPLPLTTVQVAVGAVVLAPVAAAQLPDLSTLAPSGWGALLFLALGCSVFAFLAQTWAVQRSSASHTSLLLGTEPVCAVAIGLVLGGERLSAAAAVGTALVVAGTYWGQAIERRAADPEEESSTPIPTTV